MDQIRTLLSRCASFFRRQRLDDDLDEELRSHIQLATEENQQRGMSEQEARTAALRAFGGVTQTRESYRAQRGLPFLEVLWSDLRYAVRQLCKSPGFTLTTVLTLAIGIGMNTAVFSMMDAVVLRPLAVPDLSRVVVVAEEHRRGNDDYQQVALANYQDWKQQSRSFTNLAVRSSASMSLTGAGDALHVQAALTSASFFEVLRANALLGRVYQDGECQPGHNAVAVLSYPFWQKHFGADRSVLGRSINLDGQAYTIIGVLPKSMQYPSVAEVFLPLAPTPQQLENRIAHDYLVVGRLRSGVSVQQAQEELRRDRRAPGQGLSHFEPGVVGKSGTTARWHQWAPDTSLLPSDTGRHGICFAGGVRQCSQSTVCARLIAPARDCCAHGSWRRPWAVAAPLADGKPGIGRLWAPPGGSCSRPSACISASSPCRRA